MKKMLLPILLLLFNFTLQAQEEDKDEIRNKETGFLQDENFGKNEISINALNLIAFGAVDLSYERIINQDASWSIEGWFKFNDDVEEAFYRDIALTGKYKHFFSANYARGFYVHGFTMLSSGNNGDQYYDYETDSYYYENDREYTDFALGFGIGGKLISSGGFKADFSGGIGRNLFNNDAPTITGQVMVNLGYRF